MDQLLDGAAEGGKHDSQGSIAITGDKALEKLASHAVSQPGEWILKMVQAAVAGGARKLSIRQGRNEVSLRFELAEVPSPAELEAALFSSDRPGSPMLGELVVGLRALLKDRQFSLHWLGDAGSLQWDGKALVPGKEAAEKAPLELVVQYAGGWLSNNGKERAGEATLLTGRAVHSPLPVSLDGRELTVVSLPPRSGVKKHSSFSPRHLAAGYLYPEQGPGEAAEATRWHDPMNSKDPLTRWGRKAGSTGSFSLVLSHSKETGYGDDDFDLIWTRYGVVTASHRLSKPLAGFLQISGDHLRSDLGGLSSRLEESDVADGIAALERLREVGVAAHKSFAEFEEKWTYLQMAGMAGAVAVGAVLVVGSIASSVSSPSIGDTPGGTAVSGDMREKVDEVPAVFKARFRALLGDEPEGEVAESTEPPAPADSRDAGG